MSAPKSLEWMPIESAPKDGITGVDLWFPRAGRMTNWRWYLKRKFWGNVASDRFDRIDTFLEEPTHWMPLPPCPSIPNPEEK